MESVEKEFYDNEGNYLLVALYFFDDDYKRNALEVPDGYADTDIIDISITKAYVDKPIHYSVFFKMSSWLLYEFETRECHFHLYLLHR